MKDLELERPCSTKADHTDLEINIDQNQTISSRFSWWKLQWKLIFSHRKFQFWQNSIFQWECFVLKMFWSTLILGSNVSKQEGKKEGKIHTRLDLNICVTRSETLRMWCWPQLLETGYWTRWISGLIQYGNSYVPMCDGVYLAFAASCTRPHGSTTPSPKKLQCGRNGAVKVVSPGLTRETLWRSHLGNYRDLVLEGLVTANQSPAVSDKMSCRP